MCTLWHQIPIHQVTMEELDAVTVPRAPRLLSSLGMRRTMEG